MTREKAGNTKSEQINNGKNAQKIRASVAFDTISCPPSSTRPMDRRPMQHQKQSSTWHWHHVKDIMEPHVFHSKTESGEIQLANPNPSERIYLPKEEDIRLHPRRRNKPRTAAKSILSHLIGVHVQFVRTKPAITRRANGLDAGYLHGPDGLSFGLTQDAQLANVAAKQRPEFG